LSGDGRSSAAGEFRSREVTILLADLRGFTAIAASHPAGLVIQLLNPCLIKMSEVFFRHQGALDEFMDGSIMVLFGAPDTREDDVRRALACAVEMQMTMNMLNSLTRTRACPSSSWASASTPAPSSPALSDPGAIPNTRSSATR